MPSRNIVFSGISYWARPHEGQEDEYEDKKFFKITLVPDDASWAKFARSGLKLKKKSVDLKDPKAPEGITLKRDYDGKEIVDDKTGKTKVLGGGPIPVVDMDGNPITEEIGNGSEVDILVNVYQGKYKTKNYTGHRTEKIRVRKLVPYDRFTDDFDEFEDSGVGTKTDSNSSFDDLDEEPIKVEKKTKKSDLPF